MTANGYTDLGHLTNTELSQMKYMNTKGAGLSPRDKANRDTHPSGKNSNVIVGHHYKQQAGGSIVMMPAQHHDKKHTNANTSNGRSEQHPNGKKTGGGLTATERKAFNNWRKEFYAHLAQEEINNRKKKGTYNK